MVYWDSEGTDARKNPSPLILRSKVEQGAEYTPDGGRIPLIPERLKETMAILKIMDKIMQWIDFTYIQ